MLVVLLGMVALALDGGQVYLQRRQMQTAADAAALAAARTICLEPEADWVDVGNAYCLANGADNDGSGNPCAVGLGSTERSAQATAPKTVLTWFAGILGAQFSSIDVGANAEARCSNVGAGENLLPLAVHVPLGGWAYEDDELLTNVEWELYDKESTKWEKDCCTVDEVTGQSRICIPGVDPKCPDQCDDKKGSFGLIDWNAGIGTCEPGTKCNNVTDYINNPCCAGLVYIGQELMVEPGVTTSMLKALEQYCYVPGEENTVLVPLYEVRTPGLCERGSGGSTQTYTVKAFGRFQLTGICSINSSNRCIYSGSQLDCGPSEVKVKGMFVEWISSDLIPWDDAPDTGVYVVQLSK
ncbi:MAG: Tad domain-containing protein [Anaerolineae bacterium]|nr:Tad domain-containing protein [Anaerolineae bacterium]